MSWHQETHNCENQNALVVRETYEWDAYDTTDRPWKMYTHGYDINIVFCPFCGVKLP